MAAPAPIDTARLAAIVRAFAGKRILVAGDVMLDIFVWGRISRISPEAPVPVVDVQREEAYPGGAANVARNLAALGAGVSLLGRIGRDAQADHLAQLLEEGGIDTAPLIRSPKVPTTVKTRIIARTQQVVRVDREKCTPLDGADLEQARAAIEQAVPASDAVIVEDYGKGMITQPLAEALAGACRAHDKIWTIDPNPHNPLAWPAPTAVKPNRSEAFLAAGMPFTDDPAALDVLGPALLELWRAGMVLITLGEHGMELFEPAGHRYHSPTKAREVFDVSGAGDTAIAVFTLALASGASPIEATELANHAAGVVVGKLGTATLTPAELLRSFQQDPAA